MIVYQTNLEESFSGNATLGDKYVISNQLLGKGSYAKVFRGHLKANPAVQIAVKEVEIGAKSNNPKFMQTLDREINILRRFNHPNIIQLYDVVRLPDKLFIFLELCEGGDLKQLITAQKVFPEKQVLAYMSQITDAFRVMYDANVIHRDLKPANILLSKGITKVTDFGFAREISCGMNEPMAFTRYGSPLYMCPQILQGKPFSSKCDVWSLGIIAYQMLFGKTPWIGMTPPDLSKNIVDNPIIRFPEDSKISESLKGLIVKMLIIDDKDRISWPDVFKHELIASGKNEKSVGLPNFGKGTDSKSNDVSSNFNNNNGEKKSAFACCQLI